MCVCVCVRGGCGDCGGVCGGGVVWVYVGGCKLSFLNYAIHAVTSESGRGQQILQSWSYRWFFLLLLFF